MHIWLIVLLGVNVVFNLAVWPQFVRRVRDDPRARDEHGNPTKFLKVHNVLFIAAAAVTIASLAGATLGVILD